MSKVMLCVMNVGRTDERTNAREAICPSNFFEVEGLKIRWESFKTRSTDSRLIRLYEGLN